MAAAGRAMMINENEGVFDLPENEYQILLSSSTYPNAELMNKIFDETVGDFVNAKGYRVEGIIGQSGLVRLVKKDDALTVAFFSYTVRIESSIMEIYDVARRNGNDYKGLGDLLLREYFKTFNPNKSYKYIWLGCDYKLIPFYQDIGFVLGDKVCHISPLGYYNVEPFYSMFYKMSPTDLMIPRSDLVRYHEEGIRIEPTFSSKSLKKIWEKVIESPSESSIAFNNIFDEKIYYKWDGNTLKLISELDAIISTQSTIRRSNMAFKHYPFAPPCFQRGVLITGHTHNLMLYMILNNRHKFYAPPSEMDYIASIQKMDPLDCVFAVEGVYSIVCNPSKTLEELKDFLIKFKKILNCVYNGESDIVDAITYTDFIKIVDVYFIPLIADTDITMFAGMFTKNMDIYSKKYIPAFVVTVFQFLEILNGFFIRVNFHNYTKDASGDISGISPATPLVAYITKPASQIVSDTAVEFYKIGMENIEKLPMKSLSRNALRNARTCVKNFPYNVPDCDEHVLFFAQQGDGAYSYATPVAYGKNFVKLILNLLKKFDSDASPIKISQEGDTPFEITKDGVHSYILTLISHDGVITIFFKHAGEISTAKFDVDAFKSTFHEYILTHLESVDEPMGKSNAITGGGAAAASTRRGTKRQKGGRKKTYKSSKK